MKTNQSFIRDILLAVASVLCLVSCQDDFKLSRFGEEIRFTASSGYVATKTAYSGIIGSGYERIDWKAGDLLRIYCAQSSEPAEKYADYKVTEVSSSSGAESYASIETFSDDTDGVGLRWGAEDQAHTFYAVYPSPATSGKSADEFPGDVTSTTVTLNVPAAQTPQSLNTTAAASTPEFTAVPDLRSEYMVSKATVAAGTQEIGSEEVFLDFKPIVTAIEFIITNGFATAGNLSIKSLSLTSASHNISGAFTADLTGLDEAAGAYPVCTSVSGDKTVTVTLPRTLTLTKGQSLKLTFFLKPDYSGKSARTVDDLTFRITRSDDSWMQTRLGYTDGSSISFPCHKKSFVHGLLVPEGAQWTVKFDPDVESWNNPGDTSIDPMPEVNSGSPLLTSWETGTDEELELKPNS